MDSPHRDRILDQFTRQAVPFSSAPAIRNPEALNRAATFRAAPAVRNTAPDKRLVLFARAGLADPQWETYRLEGDLDDLLSRSFPEGGDAGPIRQVFEDSLFDDALDMATHRQDGKILYGFPVAVLVATV